jgi:hypothetical protein
VECILRAQNTLVIQVIDLQGSVKAGIYVSGLSNYFAQRNYLARCVCTYKVS